MPVLTALAVVAQFDLTWWQRDLWNRDEGFYVSLLIRDEAAL